MNYRIVEVAVSYAGKYETRYWVEANDAWGTWERERMFDDIDDARCYIAHRTEHPKGRIVE